MVSLAKKQTSTTRLLGLLVFGPQLGLRPIEWRDAGRGLAPSPAELQVVTDQ